MTERGEGYCVQMASAAGLLNQIGNTRLDDIYKLVQSGKTYERLIRKVK